ncbi:hypothetical protein [Dyella monticola]|uniref:hypothetical protein n=1 Tax=Dyella monticola TaxID=1927958 RepID=UPI0011C03381|nr:hypothetical protein [Dyella monticola]
MLQRSIFTLLTLSAIAVAGCGHSTASESYASTTFPSPKDFAHRYNEFAADNLKVVEVNDIGGVGSEDWTELDLADKNAESIDGQVKQRSFNYDPRSASKDVIRNVCTWMVRAANPDISSEDAVSMATSVVDHQAKKIVSNTVLDSYDDKGCVVYYTGL